MAEQPTAAGCGSLECVWRWPGGLKATLTHYPAQGSHAPHEHDHLQVSFVLAGALRETLEGREYFACGIARGHKPAFAPHSDSWGDQGVLIFTLRLDEKLVHLVEPGLRAGWTPLSRSHGIGTLLRLVARDRDPQRQEEAALDLLAGMSVVAPPPHRPPLWLERARAAIHDAPQSLAIGAAATEAGIHRAHLSRLFCRCYGAPPSVYRRRLLVARAARGLVRSDDSLAQVAADAGFCDQSHLSRAMRADTGLTPAKARALFRQATFVQ